MIYSEHLNTRLVRYSDWLFVSKSRMILMLFYFLASYFRYGFWMVDDHLIQKKNIFIIILCIKRSMLANHSKTRPKTEWFKNPTQKCPEIDCFYIWISGFQMFTVVVIIVMIKWLLKWKVIVILRNFVLVVFVKIIQIKNYQTCQTSYSGDSKTRPSGIRAILKPNFLKFGFGMVYTILEPDLFVRF
jgi:hypothetical protein